ncbi:hypothetical protein EV651_102416 [Kribbella sp. VKM Ac-2571]|nr:hypothetical protein EV651_102416 [Kribbella sp. VKM Ac-2571]
MLGLRPGARTQTPHLRRLPTKGDGATAKDRIWTVGMSAASAQSPFSAQAAFGR